jgi:glucose-6-phosphate-specific signal transduction histidine kinase
MFRPTPSALLRWAVLYFIAGVSIGLYMAGSHDYAIAPVHAHVNLIGWVSLALAALVYKCYPATAASPLAKVHFWLSITMLPVLVATLYLFLRGNAAIEPVLALSSFAVGFAVLALVINVFKNAHD